MHDKDSKKRGMIDYKDFCRWVGNSIQLSEGFYFRHDSQKNPSFDKNQLKNEQKDTSKAKESLINSNIEKTVRDKIQQ